MTGASTSPRLQVLADRVVAFGDECGVWAYVDGDPTPRVIATMHSVSEDPRDLTAHEWAWAGGGHAVRSSLGPAVAVRGDSLFICAVPPPKGTAVPDAVLWHTDIDGLTTPEPIATLRTWSCDNLLADDDALYVRDGAPPTNEDLKRDNLDRIDRKTGAITRVGSIPTDSSFVRDIASTATHVYMLETVARGSIVSRVHRIAKTGGAVETVAQEFGSVAELRSDGHSVFFTVDGSIVRIDGITPTTLVQNPSKVISYDFAVGGGELVWHEHGDLADRADDGLFAMPAR